MEGRNNNSSSTTALEFSCCCGISWEQFQASETTPVVIFISVVLVLTSISAIVGNFLVIVSIRRTPSLHSPSNVLIVGLAVSDLCVGLLLEPIAFVYLLAQSSGLANVFCYAAVLLWFSGNLLIYSFTRSTDHYSLFQSVQNRPPSPDTDPGPGTASARVCRSRGRRIDEHHWTKEVFDRQVSHLLLANSLLSASLCDDDPCANQGLQL